MSIRNNMVLSFERNTETVRNGRRSRGPSPNGHGGTPESSSDDDCKYLRRHRDLYACVVRMQIIFHSQISSKMPLIIREHTNWSDIWMIRKMDVKQYIVLRLRVCVGLNTFLVTSYNLNPIITNGCRILSPFMYVASKKIGNKSAKTKSEYDGK